MKVFYIAETSLTNRSAYTHHVIKMCDAFQKKTDVILIIPHIKKKQNFKQLRNNFLLTAKNKFLIKSILNFRMNNFFYRILFGYKTAKYLKREKFKMIISRSLMSSIFLILFKIQHILEIHTELKGLTKFLMINCDFINSKYIKKIILISKSLNNQFPSINKEKVLILHDGVDIKNFKKKITNKKISSLTYVGSFYKGKGIELILELAKYFKSLRFNVYGEPLKKIDNISGNVKIHGYINYKKVPNALAKSDILLLPSGDLQFGRAKNINITNYNSPLKMFDYLASGKIILASKRDGICEVLKHNYNSIIVNKYELDYWIIEINKIMNKKYNLIKLRKNSIKTARRHTWDKRVDRILINCVNTNI